jgi:hypothetical protein
MQPTTEPTWRKELEEKLPGELLPLLQQRDGAAILLKKLPEIFPPESVTSATDEQRAWELTGLYYLSHRRFYEALPIFAALYDHMLAAQENNGERIHKGMPLIWISECYAEMGFAVLAKRCLMLSLCENAITGRGEVSPETTGVYFRLIWRHGLPDTELRRYARKVCDLWTCNPDNSFFPEWFLQELDQNWMTEFHYRTLSDSSLVR